MEFFLDYLGRHGVAVVFAAVLAEQVGLPIPAIPFLLAAGALVGLGRLGFAATLTSAVIASLIGDAIWYALGRVKGQRVLAFLCRISLEPDSCVGSATYWFRRFGVWTLLIAKFVPGISTVAPPMAGLTLMPVSRFLLSDIAGSALWSGAYLVLGWLFRRQLEQMAVAAETLGSRFVLILIGTLAAYVVFKYWQRRRFLRSIRVARVTPAEVHAMMDLGVPIAVVDLRGEVEVTADPFGIPGAVWMDRREVPERQAGIPRDRDVILYCT